MSLKIQRAGRNGIPPKVGFSSCYCVICNVFFKWADIMAKTKLELQSTNALALTEDFLIDVNVYTFCEWLKAAPGTAR